jgi:Na+/melibiose symporter-like transporter
MCVSVILVGVGSAYYHQSPSNQTLLWDRLPMTVAFMALMSLLLEERVLSVRRPWLLWGLIAIGVASALYWSWTESLGRGDLRPYALVQFLPVILMPLILLLFRHRYLAGNLLLSAFLLYFAAKALEHFDQQILTAAQVMSGHALKHAVAALAVWCILLAVPVHARRQ